MLLGIHAPLETLVFPFSRPPLIGLSSDATLEATPEYSAVGDKPLVLAAASEEIAERSERLTQVTRAGEAVAVLVLLSWDGKDCQECELHCT